MPGEPSGPAVATPGPANFGAPPSPLLPYLRLVRAPAVFSALGDPLAGVLAARARLPAGRAAGLAGAAAALYLGGMALNDFADRAEDARQRPERPIPSGAVPAARAAALGAGLLVAGAVLARRAGATTGGPALAAAVLAYDFGLKKTSLGPWSMGACRALSLWMGAEAAGAGREAAAPAALLGTYTAGLTLLARGETGGVAAPAVRGGALLAAAALAAAAARGGRRALPWALAVAALAGPAAVGACRRPAPERVGPAVGAMVRAMPAVGAALAAPRAGWRAAAVALPLLALARWGRALIPIH